MVYTGDMTSPRRPFKKKSRPADAVESPREGHRSAGKPGFNRGPTADKGKGYTGSRRPAKPGKQATPSHWGNVADWYDQLVGEDGSEFHRHVVFPGLMEMLQPRPRQRILDVACGQGVLCRILHHQGCLPVGVDAAKALIERARQRSNPTIDFHVGDAQDLGKVGLADESFDAATCILAIQNIPSIKPVFTGVARLLKPGGQFVMVMMHPAFRGPKATGWQWDDATQTQRRWVSHYMTPRKEAIITHPGKGEASGHTWTFHRPLQDYIVALGQAGLLVNDLQEWVSHKVSDSGPRAQAENVSREEIPMFMAISAVKMPR